MNLWTFTGRVGADGELRTTQSGDKVLNFRIANDVGFGDNKKTQWVDCTLWGKRAESLAEFMTKGKSLVVAGEVTIREFERRDGTPGSCLAVRVTEVEFTGGPRTDDGNGRDGSNGSYGSSQSRDARGGNANGSRGGGATNASTSRSGGGQSRGRSAPPNHDEDLDQDIPF